VAPHEVVLFLELVRQAREADRLSYRRARNKNRDTLLVLEWSATDMFAQVGALTPRDALCVPRRSRNPQHPDEAVCEFGIRVQGRQIYVKVTAVGSASGVAGCVVSFHFAERPLVFPFAS
jgi:hypothetical protein